MRAPKECRFNVGVLCEDGPERCRRCGWNPAEAARRREWIDHARFEDPCVLIEYLKRRMKHARQDAART